MTTLDLLEDLESQLHSFSLRAAQNGDSDIASLIHKFKSKIVQLQNDAKAELEAV
jgi:hypothetical protein